MIVALVAGAAALIGVVVGQLLARNADHRKWIRQERYLACARLLSASESLRTEAVFRLVLENQVYHAVSRATRERLRKVSGITEPETEIVEAAVVKQLEASTMADFGRSPPADVAEHRRLVEEVVKANEAVRLLVSGDVEDAADRLRRAALSLTGIDGVGRDLESGQEQEYKAARTAFVALAKTLLA